MASEGKETSEFGLAKYGSWTGIAATLLGMAVAIGAGATDVVTGYNETAGIVVGGLVSVLGIVQATLLRLGYIKSRTAVKTK